VSTPPNLANSFFTPPRTRHTSLDRLSMARVLKPICRLNFGMPPSFGDFLGFNPHLHVLISDGCFHESGMLTVAPGIDRKILKRLFRHQMLRMLLKNGKITRDMIALLDKWRHTGFNVYCGPRILPRKKTSMENLARYIIRASFSRERMTCVPEAGSVIYHSKNGQTTRVFHALELLAAMTVISRTKESRWSATMQCH